MLTKHLKEQAAKLDHSISYQLYSVGRRNFPLLGRYLKALEWSCHGIPWLVVTAVLLYTTTGRWYQQCVRLMIGLLFDIVYVAFAKAYFRRRRPVYSSQTDQMIMIGYDKLSFPSGHASRAIYVALFFTNHWFSTFVWAWAILVAISRVIYGRHYIGDVCGGIILGYLNYVTQFSVANPVHAFAEWFLLTLIADTGDDL